MLNHLTTTFSMHFAKSETYMMMIYNIALLFISLTTTITQGLPDQGDLSRDIDIWSGAAYTAYSFT